MIIPWEELPEETLRNMLQDYLLRVHNELYTNSDDFKIRQQQLMEALKKGELFIIWSELNESFNIQDEKFFRKK